MSFFESFQLIQICFLLGIFWWRLFLIHIFIESQDFLVNLMFKVSSFIKFIEIKYNFYGFFEYIKIK